MAENLPVQNRDNIEIIKDALVEHTYNFKEHIIEDTVQFNSLNRKLDQISREIQSLSDKVNPVVKGFDNITFGRLALMWILGLIGSVVAISIGFKNLFSHT